LFCIDVFPLGNGAYLYPDGGGGRRDGGGPMCAGRKDEMGRDGDGGAGRGMAAARRRLGEPLSRMLDAECPRSWSAASAHFQLSVESTVSDRGRESGRNAG
jgi:hypothetical protein